MEPTNLVVATFNCRSVKSSLAEIRQLCDQSDIVLLQEHWLLPNELDYLSNIHPDFLSHATSAVDLSQGLLVGRPYGGTAVLYRKRLMPSIVSVETFDPRVCAIQIATNLGPVLLLCVYMPTDEGNNDSMENFIATCAKVSALIAECDAAHRIVAGDFNCQPGSRYYSIFQKLVDDNNLCQTDQNRLSNVFTYCNDAGTASSWIDHVLCSQGLDNVVSNIFIGVDYISSDHKPLAVSFSLVVDNTLRKDSNENVVFPCSVTDWSKADAASILNYHSTINALLSEVHYPSMFQTEPERDLNYCRIIDEYYCAVMSCVKQAGQACLPSKQFSSARDYITPGWNEYVQGKHTAARLAFLDWVMIGKPRLGAEFQLMKTTRAQFKLALRYCGSTRML